MIKTLLISAPFAPVNLPSIGLTNLKSIAEQNGFPVELCYLGIDFAQRTGVDFYNSISVGYPSNTDLAGDFLFSIEFYGKHSDEIDNFIQRYIIPLEKRSINVDAGLNQINFHRDFVSSYRACIKIIPDWVEDLIGRLAVSEAKVFGFTTMFQQNLASLLLARSLREKRPDAIIIFGGPNCESPMGQQLISTYDFIDHVCSGEGEHAFLSVLKHYESNGKSILHANILSRNRSVGDFNTIPNKVNLDLISTPDYSDYFDQLKFLSESEGSRSIHPRVLLETSRGCWWGQKAHCTFCGLNGTSMTFRSKSADRAIEEIKTLRRLYPTAPISVVDNIIDYKYFDTLLPLLAKEEVGVELFYETKANLTRDQIRLMRSAGITRIQPGIESLSSSILKTMRKGVKAIQNICLLKWCEEEDVIPEWNFLWGFPEEDPNEYAKMAVLVPLLYHLAPPNAAAQLRLDRYSPLYEEKDISNINNIRPYPAYFEVYRENPEIIEGLAYYFIFDYKDNRDTEAYTSNLYFAIMNWRELHRGSFLIYADNIKGLLLFDGRVPGLTKKFLMDKVAYDILRVCERPCSRSKITALLEHNHCLEVTLEKLESLGILIEVDGSFFNLAIELSALRSSSHAYRAFLADLDQSCIGVSDLRILHNLIDERTANKVVEATPLCSVLNL